MKTNAAHSTSQQPQATVLNGMIRSKELIYSLIISMRLHQWAKNLFVLAPLLFGKRLTDVTAVGYGMAATISFCLLSSALYLVNDILDADADRIHEEKRTRPIAAGILPAGLALLASGGLLFASLLIAAALHSSFLAIAGTYLGVMLAYSLVFKRSPVIDCMIIASGFVLRVVGGAVVIGVEPSHWLIACTFLLALYLAFNKRRQELLSMLQTASEHRAVLGAYSVDYLDRVNNTLLGVTVVCYMLYTVSPETISYFGTDRLIYGTLFVIYALLRYMSLVQDPKNGGNPGKLIANDPPLLLAITGWAIYNASVIYSDSLSALAASLW